MKERVLTRKAIKYTLAHLFDIANPTGNIQYTVRINDGEDTLRSRKVIVAFPGSDRRIVFYLAPDEEWYKIIGEQGEELLRINNHRGTYSVPVLFWGKRDMPFAVTRGDKEVIFYGDIISSSFFMLSRWEETQNTDLDVHGRFKYENSVAHRHNFITIPVVDEYAMLLRQFLSGLFPNHSIGRRKYKVKLSHDIDDIRRFAGIKQSVRTFGGDILKTRDIRILVKSLKQYKSSRSDPMKDPYLQAIYELAKLSRHYNVESAFYFMAAEPSAYDSGYDLEDVRQCISYLQAEGFEVGFHPGYHTFRDYNKFIEEKSKLDSVLGESYYGGRQHYLRFDVNTTWQYWARAGLKYDSTLGYAEHEGFRCGTSHPFKPFDVAQDKVLNIVEKPLIIMDGTLQGYRKLSPKQALSSILNLMAKVEAVEGVFTMLWHNTSTGRVWAPWYDSVYKAILRKICI